MASAEGLNVKEGEGLVGLEELEALHFTWSFESAVFPATYSSRVGATWAIIHVG